MVKEGFAGQLQRMEQRGFKPWKFSGVMFKEASFRSFTDQHYQDLWVEKAYPPIRR